MPTWRKCNIQSHEVLLNKRTGCYHDRHGLTYRVLSPDNVIVRWASTGERLLKQEHDAFLLQLQFAIGDCWEEAVWHHFGGHDYVMRSIQRAAVVPFQLPCHPGCEMCRIEAAEQEARNAA